MRHSALILIFISILHAFRAEGQIELQKTPDSVLNNALGFKQTLNQSYLIYNHKMGPKQWLHLEVGFQFRYIARYDRVAAMWLPIKPTLASYGPIAEIGFIKPKKVDAIYLGVQYRYSTLDYGTDVDVIFDEYSIYSDYTEYWRQEHRITGKVLYTARIQKMISPFFGIGIRGVYSKKHIFGRGIDSENRYRTNAIEIRRWMTPTIHFGFNCYLWRF